MRHNSIPRQHGVVLVITLIVLVALSLAAIILFRKVDMAMLIAGNIAFKQGTTLAGDRGVEAARAWLNANSGVPLEADQTIPVGIYSSVAKAAYHSNFPYNSNPASRIDFHRRDADLANDFDWNTAATLPPAANDPYTVQYVIHRLCDLPGKPTSVSCQRSTIGGATASTKGAPSYGGYALATATQIYYQVTVRVSGPRNTISYIQAILT